MEDIALNEYLYLFGEGGASAEIENEISHRRKDIHIVKVGKEPIEEPLINRISEEEFLNLSTKVNVCISIGEPSIRLRIIEKLAGKKNIQYPNVILNDNYQNITRGYGNIIMPGTVCTINNEIGNFNYLNYNCFIAHDSYIGDYNVISPNCTVSGKCKLLNNNFLGTGVILNPLVEIDNCTISSGSVIKKGEYSNKIFAPIQTKIYDKR